MTDDVFGGLAREGSAAPSPEEFGSYDLNDLGNAKRLIRLSGAAIDKKKGAIDTSCGRLLTVPGIGWIGFNGRFWDRKHGELYARRLAHQVAEHMKAVAFQLLEMAKAEAEESRARAEAEKALQIEDEAASAKPKGRKEKEKQPPKVLQALALLEFSEACGQAGRTKAMLDQAESYLTVELEEFDRDPLALNTPNGTLKFAMIDGRFDVRLCEHDPADRITKMTRAAYDPEAACPQFERVIGDSLPVREERDYFGAFMGYSTTGYVHEQLFALAQGRGRDGKSTILDCCRETLGTYAEVGNVDTFLDGQRSPGGPDPELVKLAGDVRFVVLSEPPRGAKLAEGRIKAWTSGSPVSARDMHAKPITFRPIGKLIWECNAFPVARGDDDGIWRRVRPMMFRVQVPPDKVDKTLPAKLRAEASGVLNWLVARVGDYLARGLSPPHSLVAVLEDYRRASSPFGDWLASRCVYGPDAKDERGEPCRTLSKDLYTNFKDWFEAQGFEKPMSAKSFGDALRDRQIATAGKDRNGSQYRGPIRLKTAAELDAEAQRTQNQGGLASATGGVSATFDDDESPFQ